MKEEKRKWKERKSWRADKIEAAGNEIAYRGNPFEKRAVSPNHKPSCIKGCNEPEKERKNCKSPVRSILQKIKITLMKNAITVPTSSLSHAEQPSENLSKDMDGSMETPSTVRANLISTNSLLKVDRDCLAPDQCLTDTVVNSYMSLLSKKYETKNQIGFADSFFIWKLQCDRGGRCKIWANGIGAEILDSHKKFLVPGHKGSRWILTEVDFECSSMTIYDSFGK
jgi:hypothetical protein